VLHPFIAPEELGTDNEARRAENPEAYGVVGIQNTWRVATFSNNPLAVIAK